MFYVKFTAFYVARIIPKMIKLLRYRRKIMFFLCSTFPNRSDKFSHFTPKPWKQFQNPESRHPGLSCSHQANQTLTYLFLYYMIVWEPSFAWKSKFSLFKSTNLTFSISASNSANTDLRYQLVESNIIILDP